MSKIQPSSLQVFDRKQIAEILDIPIALIRNWSSGKPLAIKPSIRAPGKRGATNLYTLQDVYVFGVAAILAEFGMKALLIEHVVNWIAQEKVLIKGNTQGSVQAVFDDRTGKFVEASVNISWSPAATEGEHYLWSFYWTLPKSKMKLGVSFDMSALVGKINSRIRRLEKGGTL